MQFDYNNPYTSTRLPVFARNVVSTSHPLGSQAGLRMLWQGGNAVDAAIAAAASMNGNLKTGALLSLLIGLLIYAQSL